MLYILLIYVVVAVIRGLCAEEFGRMSRQRAVYVGATWPASAWRYISRRF